MFKLAHFSLLQVVTFRLEDAERIRSLQKFVTEENVIGMRKILNEDRHALYIIGDIKNFTLRIGIALIGYRR